MISLRCPRCRSIYPKGSKCPECSKRYNREKRDKLRAKFYATKRWRTTRDKVKNYYCNIDIWILGLLGTLTPASHTIIHHIYEYSKRPDLALDFDNLVCVSSSSHNYIHDYYDSGRFEEALEIINRGKALYEDLKNGKY